MQSTTRHIQVRNVAGAFVLLSALPALAQEAPMAAASAASAPGFKPSMITPTEPSLFVIELAAIVLVAFVAARAMRRRRAAR